MEFVIVDLETSGLKAKDDAIIEVALLRTNDSGEVLETFSSLVNPGFVITPEITLLTSITPEQLETAPRIESLKSQITDFIGNSPVIGHNVGFDLDFLAQNGMFPSNPLVIDTFKIAEILYHDEKSLNLSSLTEMLGYVHKDAHRAYSDVEATLYLFIQEMARLRKLSPLEWAILGRSAALSRSPLLTWMRSLVPSEAFSMTKAADIAPESPRAKSPSWLLFNEFFTNRAIREANIEWLNEINSGTLHDWEGPKKSSQSHVKKAGESAQILPTWSELLAFSDLEERPEQSRLVAAISEHFATPGHFCAEAPTGIGKTFAYLYPAITTALQTGKQVCVSTNTKNLQDQIETKDFPKIASLFEKAGISDLRLQKLKGRKNYLSILKYFEFFDQDELSDTAAILAAKIGFWMLTSKSGELDELSLYGEEYTLMDDIHAGDLRVLTPDNSYREFEYLERARLGVKRAQIIVVNHALLLSEYLEEWDSSILPKIEYVVLDEVHNLEAVATDALKTSSDFVFFEKSMHDIVRIIKKHNKLRPLEAFLSPEVTALSESLLMTARILFDEIESAFTFVQPPSKNGYSWGRSQEVLIEGEVLVNARSRMTEMLDLLSIKIHDLERILFIAPEALSIETTRVIDRLTAVHEHMRLYFSEITKDPLIRIFAQREGTPARLVSTPLSVGSVLRTRLWDRIPTIILLSATLTIENSFEYIRTVLALDSFTTEVFETDFDYSKQALLYIPPELPDVSKSDQMRSVQWFLTELVLIYGGRTLMLFTSFATIKECVLALSSRLKSAGIQILAQGLGGGKHKLASEFTRKSSSSILLGTDSFWEGVDFPGEIVELLVIYKLPFAVPTDPVFVARSRLYANAFEQYAIPTMILKFRQGLGRLIRTKSDKWIIVLMDRRVTTAWGSRILASLPKWLPVNMSSSESFLSALRARRWTVVTQSGWDLR